MDNDDIYVIVWRGRDCDSGVWDDYPILLEGYFNDYQSANARAKELEKVYGIQWDSVAEEYTSTYAMAVKKHKEITNVLDSSI